MSEENRFEIDNLFDGEDFESQTEEPSGLDTETVAAAKGMKVHGEDNRVRKTIYIPVDILEEIEAEIKKQGFGKMDFYAELLRYAWQAYSEGLIEMEAEVELVKKTKIRWTPT